MTTRATISFLAVIILASCGDGSTGGLDGDAGLEDAALDSGARDAGDDGGDAGDASAPADGGEDSGDAGEDLPWKYFIEGDECDLVSQTRLGGLPIAVNQYCRREYLGGSEFGSAQVFNRSGNLLSNSPYLCSPFESETDATKVCQPVLFCIPGPDTCHQACDPDGEPCPNTSHGDAPQECVSTDRFPQPYCRWADHL